MTGITTRTLFVVMALAVALLAAAVWRQPLPSVVSCAAPGESLCPPAAVKAPSVAEVPRADFLLLVFGLTQGSASH
nr:hypothetical protein [Pseudomonas matsuisoli]